MDEIIQEILIQQHEYPENDFDQGWNYGLSCAIGIIELYSEKYVTLDEGIKIGADLAAMHGSDASSKELEKTFFDGIEEGWKKARKIGTWILHKDGSATCSECRCHQANIWDLDTWQNFCGRCGAMMKKAEPDN